MANARISLIQIENRTLQSISILDYSSASSLEEDYVSTESEDMSTSPNTSCRSSKNADRSIDPEEDFRKELIKFDDIIKKIENLRFTRNDSYDNEDDDNDGDDEDVGETRRVVDEKVDNAAWVNNRDTPWTNRCTDNEDVNNNAAINENEDCQPLNISDNEPCDKEHYTPEEKLRENSTDDDENADDVDLIERGPIKPDFQSIRGRPYSMVRWLTVNNDTVHAVDYDKTAEQILRNKDYSEKLNPCLDQLSCLSRHHLSLDGLPIDSGWIGENVDNNVYRGDDSRSYTATLPSIVIDPGEESLMDILLRGDFQAAVFSDVGSHSIPSPSAKTWSDSPASSYNYVPSRSNSRASSRAQSPGSGANLESPQMHVNVIGSPLGSPQIGSTYRVSQELSTSSSSNQSYGDTSSPSNYQTALNYQLKEQLGDCFESSTDWKSDSYDSSSTVVNSSDTIDCMLLQLVDQVIEEDKQQKAPKEQQVASSAPCFSSTYNDQCVPVCTLESNLSPVSRSYLSSETWSARSESCMNMPSASSIIDSLIDGCLVSVYTNKESTGGCTLMSRTIDSHATMSPMEQRYYEPGLKNGTRGTPIDSVSQHGAALYNIGLNGERSARASQQNVSQGRHTLLCNVDGEKRPYDQPSSFVSDNYQLPTMVSSFASNCPQRKSDRGIVPWPSLNLPSVRASERLKEGLHPKEVERAMSNLLKKSVEELAAADEDGDTELMCLVGNPEELIRKKAYLAPLVERLGNMSGALSMVNNRGEDALYLAAINCPEMPYVTGYLAAAMLQKGIDIGQSLYHGDTLIHSIAARGDSHGEILADLLVLKTQQGNPVFDLSKCNHDGKTALHVAVESHDPVRRGVKSLATTRLLLENGANLRIKNPKCGNTALHVAVSLSCDPALVKVLLRKVTSDVVNETNYMYNTPLHIVAAISSTVSLEKQQEVCQLLIQAGGQTNMQNRQGKTPLALVSPDRKEAIRKIFYKKS